MDKVELGFPLMQKKNQDVIPDILNANSDKVKSNVNYIANCEQYSKMFEAEWLGRTRDFHITWDDDLNKKNR